MHNKIKLNHNCVICKKTIYIDQNPISGGEFGPCHLKCLLEKQEKEINKIKIITKCSECGEVKPVGEKTGNCLECLDWKMGDLQE